MTFKQVDICEIDNIIGDLLIPISKNSCDFRNQKDSTSSN